MTIAANLSVPYADLGEAWVRQQLVRLHQRHLQCGRHFRLDVDGVLNGAAMRARSTRVVGVYLAPATAGISLRIAREAIEACDHLADAG